MRPVFRFTARERGVLRFRRTVPVRSIASPAAFTTTSPNGGSRPGPRRRCAAQRPLLGALRRHVRGFDAAGAPLVTLQRTDFQQRLRGFAVLCLANEACLSETQLAAVRRFVADGGGLLATHETSLYDEKGNRRPDLGLADVLGLH